jgi:preprotein translocase subunit YajC
MSKKVLMIIIVCMLAISIVAVMAGCSLLYPTTAVTTAVSGTTVAGQTTATTAVPATGWKAVFANYGTWIWLIILAVAFYFLLIRPQRTRTKKAQDLMSNLKRGDEIITIGGFYGRIKDVREDNIIITIAGGVDVKITKSAIARTISTSSTDSQTK